MMGVSVMRSVKKNMYRRKALYLIAFIVIILKAFLSVGLAVILQKLVDSFNNTSVLKVLNDVKYIIIFIIMFVLVQMLYSYLTATIVKMVLSNLKDNTIKSILGLSIEGFKRDNTSKYISLLTNHIEDIEKDLLNSWITLLDMLIMLIFSVVMLFVYSPIIGGVSLIATLFSLVIPVFLSNYGNILKLKYSMKQEDLTRFTKDILNGFNLIKEYKVEYNILKKYNKKNSEVEICRYKYNFALGIIMGISMFLGYIIFFIVIIVGLLLSVNNSITVGTLIACVNLSNSLVNPVMNGLEQIFRIKSIKGVAEKFDVKEDINRKREFTINKPIEKIEFKNVSFDYGNNRGIKNINLSFEKGKKYLLVGTSGSGKSTILKLIAGFYGDFSGDILIDNKDIRKIEEESLSKVYSMVNQDSFLFDGTIEENIRFFQIVDESRINQAVKQAELEKIIEEQVDKIKLYVGEDGSKLSGGEKQRIALARALVRDSEVLLLDEATSNLDNGLSLSIEKNILETPKMIIAIAHRINKEMADKYDEIIAINEGEIVEVGSFNELIENKGYFYSLCYLKNLNESRL